MEERAKRRREGERRSAWHQMLRQRKERETETGAGCMQQLCMGIVRRPKSEKKAGKRAANAQPSRAEGSVRGKAIDGRRASGIMGKA